MQMMMADIQTMNQQQAEHVSKMALAGLHREYPNKPGDVLRSAQDVKTPRLLHPVFYGHFDWHSSVHGHWTLVRSLRLFPQQEKAEEIRKALEKSFTRENLQAEADYFSISDNASFERMYGWAWALRLAMELRSRDDVDGKRWSEYYAPLEQKIVSLSLAYLPKLDWPVRCGFHPESSFAMSQLLDYARFVKNTDLEKLVVQTARKFYQSDRDYPVRYEPSGNDFFSPCLNVADLMRRVLTAQEFSLWLDSYLPGLAKKDAGNLLKPVVVSDPKDGHLIHLAGLNLSRCWTMKGIASALPDADPRRVVLLASAAEHFQAGMVYVDSGNYEGDHWLGSFAVYALASF